MKKINLKDIRLEPLLSSLGARVVAVIVILEMMDLSRWRW
jgi:hypothetical protein